MNPSQKERLPLRLEKLYREIGELMMEDVVRRIKKTGKITSTADYQINRLVLLGATSEEIEKEIKKRTELALVEMYEMYDNVINWEYVRSRDIYEQINSEFIPWEENYQLQQISKALIEQSENELKNLTQSMGFAIEMNGKMVFTPMSEYYQKYLDQTMLGIVTGAFDYNSALRKCITQMTNSGIRTVDYATGHSNRIEVAARRAVMTGISQLTGKISDYNAQKLGTEYFEVAWHSGARNTGSGYLNHQSWQGKVYTRQQLIEICGLGLGGGLEGWNCYHERYPFFPGISERNWTDEWLKAKNQEENTPKEYKGKTYNAYQATQKQRQIETSMRAQREKVRLLQKGKADADTIMDARIKYQLQLDEYGRFSKKMGLVQQRERIYLDMKGRVAPNKDSTQSYLREQIKKKAEKAEKDLNKIRFARFSDRFQEFNNGQKDTITFRRLLNNLNKSNIGKEVVEYILAHPELNIMMCYKVDVPETDLGKQEDKDIYIFASNTKTVQKTAETLIHEITHYRYDIGGCQWAECVCRAQELKHRNNAEKLTPSEMRDIIKSVKRDYPELKWR